MVVAVRVRKFDRLVISCNCSRCCSCCNREYPYCHHLSPCLSGFAEETILTPRNHRAGLRDVCIRMSVSRSSPHATRILFDYATIHAYRTAMSTHPSHLHTSAFTCILPRTAPFLSEVRPPVRQFVLLFTLEKTNLWLSITHDITFID